MPDRLLEYNGRTYAFPEGTTDQEAFDFIDREEVAGAIQRGMQAKAPEETIIERILGRGAAENLGTVSRAQSEGLAAYPQTLAKSARYAVPAYAAIATGGASIPAMMTAGAGSSAIGEAIAQTAEEGSMRPREVAGAAIRGGVPAIPGGFGAALGNIGMQMGAGVLASRVEGRSRDVGGDVTEAAKTGILPTVAETVRLAAGRLGGTFARGAERAADIERIGPGVRATTGQAFPGTAALEPRAAATAVETAPKVALAEQNKAIMEAFELIGAKDVSSYDLAMNLSTALGSDEAQEVANAARNLTSAASVLEKARGSAQATVAREAQQQALDEFNRLVTKGSLKATGAYEPLTAGRLVEQSAQGARDGFVAKSEELYAPLNPVANKPVFDTTTIADKALDVTSQYPQLANSEIAKSFAPNLSRLQDIMNLRTPASLQALKDVRKELYDFADYAGKALGDNEQRMIRGIADEITNTINSQAKSVLGPQLGQTLLDANKFYAKFRPRLNFYGVRQGFTPETKATGTMGEKALQEVSRFGADAPYVANLTSLLDDLSKAGVKGVPSSRPILDQIRAGLVKEARLNGTGPLDMVKLESTLLGVESQMPGSLAKLGLSNIDDIKQAAKFQREAGEALSKGKYSTLESLLPKGTPARLYAIQALSSLKNQQKAMSYLAAEAMADPTAAKALQDLRSRYLNDLLIELTVDGTKPRLDAISDLLNKAEIQQEARTILGDSAVDSLLKDIIPGFKRLAEYEIAKGGAGSATKASQQMRLTESVARGVSQAATNPQQAATTIIGNYLALGAYSTVAKILSSSIGSSGLRSRARFLSEVSKNAQKYGIPASVIGTRALSDRPEEE